MSKQIIYSVIGGLSGGLIYFLGKDLYYQYIDTTSTYFKKDLSFGNIINPGLILGSGLGFFYEYSIKRLKNND